MTDKEKLIALTRLHDAANKALEELGAKNKELQDENNLLLKKIVHCQDALDITKEIMRNALTNQNAIKDAYVAEINELREKIKRLES